MKRPWWFSVSHERKERKKMRTWPPKGQELRVLPALSAYVPTWFREVVGASQQTIVNGESRTCWFSILWHMDMLIFDFMASGHVDFWFDGIWTCWFLILWHLDMLIFDFMASGQVVVQAQYPWTVAGWPHGWPHGWAHGWQHGWAYGWPHGDNMVTTWWSQGDHMVTTWWPHGNASWVNE